METHIPIPESFSISVANADLADLRRRLDGVRWPAQAAVAPWSHGADLGYMKSLVAHWRDRYDWRHWERRLNHFTGCRVAIGGKRVHVLVEPGSGRAPLPLLLLHGWPGSLVEFLDVIEPLAHPERFGGRVEDAFTVVVPSLPGFGFSDAPDTPLTPVDIAQTLSTLMGPVLGYRRYAVQGGDWGGIVGSWMALNHPDGIAALHLNGLGLSGGHPRPEPADDPLTPEELDWLERDAARRAGHMAYQQIQGTEPQTLAYGLTDSPAGLAAWIVQRFHDWTVRGSDGPPPFDMDHLLTNVMLYWLGGINAPNWLYISLVDGTARRVGPGRRIMVPTGFTFCPDDNIVPPPDRWLSRVFANIVHRRDAPRGGHFFAFEQPDLFIETVRTFFRNYR